MNEVDLNLNFEMPKSCYECRYAFISNDCYDPNATLGETYIPHLCCMLLSTDTDYMVDRDIFKAKQALNENCPLKEN